MRKTTLALATLAMLTGTAHSTCYTLYAADGRMLSSSPTPPYSLAWPTEDPAAKSSRARGDHLIISQGGCHAVPVEQPKTTSAPKPVPVRQVSRTAPASPEQTLEQQVRWFVSKGRSIDRENVPACMSQMRDLKPQVESLRALLDRMERSGDLLTLSEALASAQLCVTCTDSAMESCARADAALSRLRGTPMSVADAAANSEIEQLRAQRPVRTKDENWQRLEQMLPYAAPAPQARAYQPSYSGSSGGGSGLCQTPDDRDAKGNRCGKRARSER